MRSSQRAELDEIAKLVDANEAFVELVTSRDAFISDELAEMLQVESFNRYFKQLEVSRSEQTLF